MACKKKDKKTETPITEAQVPGVEALDDQEAGQVSGGKGYPIISSNLGGGDTPKAQM